MASNSKKKVNIELIPDYLNGELIVKFYFNYNKDIIEAIKTIPGRRWNQEKRYWYFLIEHFDLPSIQCKLKPMAKIDVSALEATTQRDIPHRSQASNKLPDHYIPPQYLEKLVRKRYSPNTIKTYVSYIKSFAKEFQDRSLESVSTQQINAYILKLIQSKGISSSQQNQRINAIKFYYEQVLGRKKEYYQISRPKKEKRLPNILRIDEVELLLKHCNNLKHK